MGPERFREFLGGEAERLGGDEVEVYGVGAVGDFHVGVIDNTITDELGVVIANQVEGDDSVAVYEAYPVVYDSDQLETRAVMYWTPLRSSLPSWDVDKLGAMAAANAADVPIVVYPDGSRPNTFMGLPIVPLGNE